jgi:hypothetical protein
MNAVRTLVMIAALFGAATVSGLAHAEHRDDRRDGEWREHVDARHGLGHRYPDRGVIVRTVPRAAIVVRRGPARYWFDGGVWYGWGRRGYVVVAPPVGVVVPILPRAYVTLSIGGLPYYYANDVYYVRRDTGYVVVDPPPGADSASPSTAASSGPPDDVYAYPRNGQSEEQQSRDRYECHRWAADQTGFDPTRAGAGSGNGRADYMRALGACLDARGYTVR